VTILTLVSVTFSDAKFELQCKLLC